MSSKETIQQLPPKAKRETQLFGQKVKPIEIFDEFIHNPSEKGWHFGTGDPEFWKFSDRLIVPGGKALDLGMGIGRTSVPFALQGMEVTGYETNPIPRRIARRFTRALDLPISIQREDVRYADLGKNMYDTVLLGETFIHFESETEAIKVIDKAIDATKPGGHIWLRAAGKEDSKYTQLILSSYMNAFMNPFQDPEAQIQDSLMAPCACSGELKMEPHLFFDPIGLVAHMAGRDIKIVHTQVIPEFGKQNIMYGENWQTHKHEFDEDLEDQIDRADIKYGLITILGQKK